MGVLSVSVGDDGVCKVEFLPGPAARVPDDGAYEVHIALLGDGLFSKITDGENSGQMLVHDFVVLGLTSRVMTPIPGTGPVPLRTTMALPTLSCPRASDTHWPPG